MNQVSCYVKILIMKILHIVTKCLISYLKSMHGFFMIYEFLARLKFSVLALNFIQTPSIGLIKRFYFQYVNMKIYKIKNNMDVICPLNVEIWCLSHFQSPFYLLDFSGACTICTKNTITGYNTPIIQ